MKKQLITLGLAVLSVPAFASKARLESLGQSADGSQYIDDHRSIFLNVAALNTHKDFATIEVGSAESTVDATGTDVDESADSASNPRAEGGVFKSSGNMVYGIYFGDESDGGTSLRSQMTNGVNAATGGAVAAFDKELMERNSVNFYVGGDAGLQWGASFQMQSYKDETGAADVESSAMRGQFGVVSGDWDAFLNFGLGSKADNGTIKFEGTSAIDFGLTYNMGDTAYMLRRTSGSAEVTVSGTTTDTEVTALSVGVARSYKLNDKATMWASAFYKTSEVKDSDKTTDLPVTISLETSATDWLTLRGFVSSNVFIGETEASNGKKKTNDGVSHGVGASLVYGDLTIDGSLILSDASGTPGTLNIDEPMNRVSLTYNF